MIIYRHPACRSERGGLTLGEVTALQHEAGDYTMERTSSVPESVVASCELTEVLGRLGDDIVVQLEYDATGGLAVNTDIELVIGHRIRICEESGLVRLTKREYVRRRWTFWL